MGGRCLLVAGEYTPLIDVSRYSLCTPLWSTVLYCKNISHSHIAQDGKVLEGFCASEGNPIDRTYLLLASFSVGLRAVCFLQSPFLFSTLDKHSVPITNVNMANSSTAVVRQVSRLSSRHFYSSNALVRGSSHFRTPATSAANRAAHRTYVSESKPDKAQVSVETAIKADQHAFTAQTGKLPEKAKMPGTEMSADVMMSPAAGILKQATVMDEGTRPIYLDMQATTPTDPRVLDAMLPFFTGLYGNPHSRTHAYGWETEKATEQAREHVANLIGADPKEIIFTSGATESNNMSIKGVARFFGRSGKKKHIITTQTEHKCVLDSCRHMQEEGFEVTYLPVQQNGLIDLKELEAAIRKDTALVSIMTVNNEIGVIQPMEEIGKLCRAKKTFFHTDGAQAVGKIPINVDAWNVDLMSISAHKIYGPKGIGACYVRRRPRVRIDPIISGGGQERGLRSGTLAPPLVVGFGEACRIAKEEMPVSFTLSGFNL